MVIVVGCSLCKSLGNHSEEEIASGAKDFLLAFPYTVLKIRGPDNSAEVSSLWFADAEVTYC